MVTVSPTKLWVSDSDVIWGAGGGGVGTVIVPVLAVIEVLLLSSTETWPVPLVEAVKTPVPSTLPILPMMFQ